MDIPSSDEFILFDRTPFKATLAGCLIRDERGRVLLIHRSTPGREQWELPGGKIEEGESPEQTAMRELKEELGVGVELDGKLGEESFVQDSYRLHYMWYAAHLTQGEPQVMEEEYDELSYFSWEELRDMERQLSPNAVNLVRRYFAGELSEKFTRDVITQ